MHVGGEWIGIIQRADADEADDFAQAAAHGEVVCPVGDVTRWAAREPLANTAERWGVNFDDVAFGDFDAIRFDQGIHGKRSAAFALAPTAVAAVNDHWLGSHFIAYGSTGTSAFKGGVLVGHGSDPLSVGNLGDGVGSHVYEWYW